MSGEQNFQKENERRRKSKISASTKYQRRHHAVGLCAKCPEPTGINPETGRHFHLCAKHRARMAEINKSKMKLFRAKKKERQKADAFRSGLENAS